MLTTRRNTLILAVVLFLSACAGGEDPDADVMGETPGVQSDTTTSGGTAGVPSQVAMPVEVSSDTITLGTSADGNRVVKAALPSFRISDTVHAGIAGSHPPGTQARVYWTNQKSGLSDKQEAKTTAEDGVVFTFDRNDGMKPGRYTVQVDVGGKPAGIADFEVN